MPSVPEGLARVIENAHRKRISKTRALTQPQTASTLGRGCVLPSGLPDNLARRIVDGTLKRNGDRIEQAETCASATWRGFKALGTSQPIGTTSHSTDSTA